MANAPVLKTGVRKDLGVRIPRPPLQNHCGRRAVLSVPRLQTMSELVANRHANLSRLCRMKMNVVDALRRLTFQS